MTVRELISELLRSSVDMDAEVMISAPLESNRGAPSTGVLVLPTIRIEAGQFPNLPINQERRGKPWITICGTDAWGQFLKSSSSSASMKQDWFIEKYDLDHYGLKCTEPHDCRGVPEGTRLEWEGIVSAMRSGMCFRLKRLAYDVENGITSPRNTNKGNTKYDERFLVEDPISMANWLEAQLEALKDAPYGTQSPPKGERT